MKTNTKEMTIEELKCMGFDEYNRKVVGLEVVKEATENLTKIIARIATLEKERPDENNNTEKD